MATRHDIVMPIPFQQIQDEAAKYGIKIVANSERAALNKLKLGNMVQFPSLVFFHNKEPTIYEGM